MARYQPIFPRWVDHLNRLVILLLIGGGLYTIVLVAYATSPQSTAVGYQPVQPVPYSHELHAGQLGMDCRYCHQGVEAGAKALIPATNTCMNCHQQVWPNSPKLALIRESYATGMPVQWVRIHDLPDFVYFDHSAHVNNGIGCVTCHGRVDKMGPSGVFQAQPLNMGWCLDCHRQPEKYLRPKEFITVMDWTPSEDQLALGRRLREEYNLNPSTDCSTCHR
jgi:menaquinone reductase, multiheme cytochrome c subunit